VGHEGEQKGAGGAWYPGPLALLSETLSRSVGVPVLIVLGITIRVCGHHLPEAESFTSLYQKRPFGTEQRFAPSWPQNIPCANAPELRILAPANVKRKGSLPPHARQ